MKIIGESLVYGQVCDTVSFERFDILSYFFIVEMRKMPFQSGMVTIMMDIDYEWNFQEEGAATGVDVLPVVEIVEAAEVVEIEAAVGEETEDVEHPLVALSIV